MQNLTFVAPLVVPSAPTPSRRQIEYFSLMLISRRLINSVAVGWMDAMTLTLAIGVASLMPAGPSLSPLVPITPWPVIYTWWAGAALVGLLPGWGLSTVEHLRRQVMLLISVFAGFAMLVIGMKALDPSYVAAIAVACACAIVLVPLGRMLVRHLLCSWNFFGMPTIVFGKADVAADLIERLRTEQGLGYSPVGVCTDDAVESVAGLPVLGRLSQVNPIAAAAVVASRGIDREENDALMFRVLRVYSNVLILPEVTNVPSLFVLPRDLGGAVGLEISQSLLSPFERKLKRLVDLTLVSLTMPLWMPLCGFIWLAIWFSDRETPMFWQERAGRRGRSFRACKFRTMVSNAESVLKKHLAADPELRAEWEKNRKLRKDPRVTPIGVFLRKSSLDELPQLLNVLRGEMALVGPRPLPVYHLNDLPESVREIRHEVRPGLTGLWQVSGRSDAGNTGMVRWDPYYVRNWSMWLDIVIMVRTIRVVLRGSGAR